MAQWKTAVTNTPNLSDFSVLPSNDAPIPYPKRRLLEHKRWGVRNLL